MDQCMTDLKQHQYNYNQKLHVSRNRKKNVFSVAKMCKYALDDRSEGIFCGLRKALNPCHPPPTPKPSA